MKFLHRYSIALSLVAAVVVAGLNSIPVGANNETSYQVLSFMPQLPDFPQYTGNYKLLRSVIMPQSFGGATYGIFFEAKENPQIVYNWYTDALRGEKWGVDTKSGNGRIDANKKGNLVRVHVSSNGGEMHSTVMIEYRIVKAIDVGSGDDEENKDNDKDRNVREHR